MGLTYTTATVEAVDRGEPPLEAPPLEARFLVNTGAIDCLLGGSLLHQPGIEPEGTDVYELADGETKEMSYGWARITFLSTVAIVKVIFGPDGVEPILGVIALESAGVAVDPVTRTLKRAVTRHLKKARGSVGADPARGTGG